MDHLSIQDTSFYHLEALQVVHHFWNPAGPVYHPLGHLDLFCSGKNCAVMVEIINPWCLFIVELLHGMDD